MGKLEKAENLCIKCRKCEEVCSKQYFRENNREKSAIRIGGPENGQAIITVCTQCGACMSVCPVEAITRAPGGVYRIDKKRCVGCLACVGFCPEAAMFHFPGNYEPFKCIACGLCAAQCPSKAIFAAAAERSDNA